MPQKGLENKGFSNRNPQGGLCPLEENWKFQGVYTAGTYQFNLCFNKKKA